MTSPRLGRLESVDLGRVWEHEARDFTPWLLANADALGEALGMELEMTAAEHRVGDFWLDLIGTDLSTGHTVIVENQLGPTDHTHLGQLLTYAGGTDAVNIVWIARLVREEHRAALDWLNARTDQDTRFFGVEVSAVRIGDSLPAPLFQVVVQPNDWGKTVRATTKAPTERSLLYAEFWDRFIAAMNEAGLGGNRTRKGPPESWFDMATGVSGVQYMVSFIRNGLQSAIYFNGPDPHVNTRRFSLFDQSRDVINKAYNNELSFEPLDGHKSSRICDRAPGEIADQASWPAFIEWFVDSQRRLRLAVDAGGGVRA